ncbi:non-histone protein [Dimargaris verticillata]|uniref:Non-histone protein n=1 Tax=Dimargaris verticillata TaxID=2761393 RepID=A0A9W8B434_9FUNG|nr:non-histone protein [Dimargaris verticillata]
MSEVVYLSDAAALIDEWKRISRYFEHKVYDHLHRDPAVSKQLQLFEQKSLHLMSENGVKLCHDLKTIAEYQRRSRALLRHIVDKRRAIARTKANIRLIKKNIDQSKMQVNHKRLLRYLEKNPEMYQVLDEDDLEDLDNDYGHFRRLREKRKTHREKEDMDDDVARLLADDDAGSKDKLDLDGKALVDDSAEPKQKKKRRSRKQKDPSFPKKPQNAYFRYRDQELTRIKAEQDVDSVADLTKLISENWKNMSEEDRRPFYEEYYIQLNEYRSAVKPLLENEKAKSEGRGRGVRGSAKISAAAKAPVPIPAESDTPVAQETAVPFQPLPEAIQVAAPPNGKGPSDEMEVDVDLGSDTEPV